METRKTLATEMPGDNDEQLEGISAQSLKSRKKSNPSIASSTAVVRLKTLGWSGSNTPNRFRLKSYIFVDQQIGSPLNIDRPPSGQTFTFPSGSDSPSLNVPFSSPITCIVKDLDTDELGGGQSTQAVSSNDGNGSVTVICSISGNSFQLILSYKIID